MATETVNANNETGGFPYSPQHFKAGEKVIILEGKHLYNHVTGLECVVDSRQSNATGYDGSPLITLKAPIEKGLNKVPYILIPCNSLQPLEDTPQRKEFRQRFNRKQSEQEKAK